MSASPLAFTFLERNQVATLVAVLREGSFDRAARTLHVTPSAVSQRIKQLEEAVGGIVVVRGAQTQATRLGDALYRHGLQLELLEMELSVALRGGEETLQGAPVNIAINADSLATWIAPALTKFSQLTQQSIEVLADDQDHTSHWLQTGRVLGAITTEARAVQGCRVIALGSMRYRANASPEFMKRLFPEKISAAALRKAPIITFDRKDLLHEQFLAECGIRNPPKPTHFFPSPQAIVEASIAGIGWSVNPEALVLKPIARKRLVDVFPGRWLDVPLYWQCWSMSSQTIAALTEAIKVQAARELGPV